MTSRDLPRVLYSPHDGRRRITWAMRSWEIPMDGTQHAARVVDPFNLGRFVEAQGPVYSSALRELQRGRKTTHWIWFIFPQLRGLGYSSTSKYYAISGGDEAQQYLGHPLLGARLVECSRAVLGHAGRSALDIFGSPDDVKLRSC